MDALATLATLALVGIATAAGGVAVRLAALVESPAAAATLALVAVAALALALLAAASRPRLSTPYWG